MPRYRSGDLDFGKGASRQLRHQDGNFAATFKMQGEWIGMESACQHGGVSVNMPLRVL